MCGSLCEFRSKFEVLVFFDKVSQARLSRDTLICGFNLGCLEYITQREGDGEHNRPKYDT